MPDESGAARIADPARPAARAAIGRAGHSHSTAVGAGRPRCQTGPCASTSVEIEGVTAYPQPEIAKLAAGLVGPAVPLPQIDAARQAILQRYRADGYVLTTVSANLDRQRQAALRRHRRAHRQRQARRRHRPGRHPGAALPQSPDREAADRFGHTGALPAAGAGRAGRHACARCWSRRPTARRAEPDRAGEPPDGSPAWPPWTIGPSPRPGRSRLLGVLDFNSFTALGEKTEVSFYHTLPNSQNFGQASERDLHRRAPA